MLAFGEVVVKKLVVANSLVGLWMYHHVYLRSNGF